MPRHAHELSGRRELVQGAALRLPFRGLSCPGNEPRDNEPPFDGSSRLPEPNRLGDTADPRSSGVAGSHELLTTPARKPPASARPRVRERILVAILRLALAAVLTHAARRATAIGNHISRRSR
jgi:hypothetical protein